MKLIYYIIFIVLLNQNLIAKDKISNFDKLELWKKYDDGKSKIIVQQVKGKYDKAIKINYKLKGNGSWVGIKKDIKRKIKKNSSLNFYIKSYALSFLEIKFIDNNGSVFGKKISLINKYEDWTHLKFFLNDLNYWWGGDNKFDELKTISLALSGNGEGIIILDEINFNEKYKIKPQKKIGTLITDPKIYQNLKDKKTILSKIVYPDSYTVSIDDEGWFVVNGERFFIKGMQLFEHHNIYRDKDGDGKKEYNLEHLTYSQLDYTFKLIKQAGFNAVSGILNPKELELAKKNGLLVFQTASGLYFTDMRKVDKEQAYKRTRDIVQYSKKHDNVMGYFIDNEPNVCPGIFITGKNTIKNFHNKLIQEVKNIDKSTFVTFRSFPPAGFLDHSIYDFLAINLYPGVYDDCLITYDEYGEWFRNKHQKNNPYIVTEYGWHVSLNINEFSEAMINTLDDQIKMGAKGSFFFIWRVFGEEKKDDNGWYGFIPTFGGENDYKRKPRQIYYDYQKYNKAIVLEPKKETIYTDNLPIKVYGTDLTGAIKVKFNNKKYKLKKQGKYWWKSNIRIKPVDLKKQTVIIDAVDKNNNLLVRKKVDFYISPEMKYLIAKIKNYKYNKEKVTAVIKVFNNKNKIVPNSQLRISVNQANKALFGSDSSYKKTDKNGEYKFIWNDVKKGYFTIMAAPIKSDNFPQVYADVVTIKIIK